MSLVMAALVIWGVSGCGGDGEGLGERGGEIER